MLNNKPETLPISRSEFQALDLFCNVSFESIAGYLLNCPIINVEPQDVLICPKTKSRRVLILIEGLLEVRMNGTDGLFLDDVTPGSSVGEMSVFDNASPSAWVIAKKASRLLAIDAATALQMLKVSNELCLNFMHILSQRVRYSNKIVFADQHSLRCMEENAMVDTLTGLHNRRWLEDMYTREIQRSNAGDFKLAAYMLDIDHFKDINDTYGHFAGDQVLIGLARTLIECLRPSDMPVRFGGEEFSVFLPGTAPKDAAKIAERIRAAVEKHRFQLQDGTVITVTVSVGYAERDAGDSVQSLLEKADKALYVAKNTGRNRACMYQPSAGEQEGK